MAPASEAEGELMALEGHFYWVSNGNVYEYDQLSEKAGNFVGRLKADGGINTNAPEVMKGGSRKTRTRRHFSKNRKTKGRRH